jgi:AcrR family transcriptional regulator
LTEIQNPGVRPRRDAARTRQRLLEAARGRFARDGYAMTTVRDIADDAGVNVALINRYFTSKEGLFEACLTSAVTDIRRDVDVLSRGEVATAMARRIAGPTDGPRMQEALMLMLRSSGDDRIDSMRSAFLRSLSEQLAATAGGQQAPAADERLILRAQIVLAASLGLVVLRSFTSLQPIATAGEEDLLEPLSAMIEAMLPAPGPQTGPPAG